ncbi:hypothetical protein BDV36DRAFT_262445 [Aspergillus pseudocaelatus]|uniref:Uncharacterized protein n=1 Tax=Aspergillus pseudocaelatus TaxID=1825620 RepID=A0ABQ6WF57_9EURO|nr:hypothetical protein BDV36DRAFT_262445 [Aspergillus pseudocaelatus]
MQAMSSASRHGRELTVIHSSTLTTSSCTRPSPALRHGCAPTLISRLPSCRAMEQL